MTKKLIGRKTLDLMAQAKNYNAWLFRQIQPYLGREVLEVGSGIGTFTPLLLLSGGTINASDIEPGYLKLLNDRFKNKRMRVSYADIESGEHELGKKRFDTIICLNVLEHIEDDQKALDNAYSLLKRGGKLLLLVPAYPALFGLLDENLEHKRRYSKGALLGKIKNAGFRIETTRRLNLLGAIGWFFNARIFPREIIPANQLAIFDKISRPFLSLESLFRVPVGLSVFVVARRVK